MPHYVLQSEGTRVNNFLASMASGFPIASSGDLSKLTPNCTVKFEDGTQTFYTWLVFIPKDFAEKSLEDLVKQANDVSSTYKDFESYALEFKHQNAPHVASDVQASSSVAKARRQLSAQSDNALQQEGFIYGDYNNAVGTYGFITQNNSTYGVWKLNDYGLPPTSRFLGRGGINDSVALSA